MKRQIEEKDIMTTDEKLRRLGRLEIVFDLVKTELSRLNRENKRLKLENIELKRKCHQGELFNNDVIDEELL